MHSPSSRRLRRLRCQLAACTAPKEAAQHPEPRSALTPSLPRCCQALRDGSNSWEEQGEPARLLLRLHLTPVVLRSRPQKYLPLPEPGPAGVKGPLEALLPRGSLSTVYLYSFWDGGTTVKCPLGPASDFCLTPTMGPANKAKKHWELHSCRCFPTKAVPRSSSKAADMPRGDTSAFRPHHRHVPNGSNYHQCYMQPDLFV